MQVAQITNVHKMFTKCSQNVHDFHVKAVIMYIVNDDTQLIINTHSKSKFMEDKTMKKATINFQDYPNLYNLLTIPEMTDTIIVEDDGGLPINLTELIIKAAEELGF